MKKALIILCLAGWAAALILTHSTRQYEEELDVALEEARSEHEKVMGGINGDYQTKYDALMKELQERRRPLGEYQKRKRNWDTYQQNIAKLAQNEQNFAKANEYIGKAYYYMMHIEEMEAEIRAMQGLGKQGVSTTPTTGE